MVARTWYFCVEWVHDTFTDHPVIGVFLILAGSATIGWLASQTMTEGKELAGPAPLILLGSLILARCPECPHFDEDEIDDGTE